jgi:endonuclease/exonuclease/phosphatase family metal-dependent hydrolase
MKNKYLYHSIAMGMLVFNAGLAQAASGSFSTLTYNIAGLPELFSSAESSRQEATEQISCYANEFSFVNVQEDFNYHAALYDTCNTHPYRSPTTGGAGFGSGLNSMSYFPYADWTRVRWNNCNGVDCLTPKGFTMARTRLAEGVYVDIYNLHTQAQVEEADLSARRANIKQLIGHIEQQSAGNAVIVMGDTNTRYTRSGDNMWEFLRRGFTDLWVSEIRYGDVPEPGAPALTCSPAVTRPDCEIVDKVLFRDNGYVNLEAVSYAIREDAVNSEGVALSDHPPVEATWIYNTASNRRLSDPFGGPHGIAFNDVSLLPENPDVGEVSIRAGERIDKVEITLSNGYVFSHGGNGGEERSLTLSSGEYLTSLDICSGKQNNRTRIFRAKFTTSDGRTLSGGTGTSNCTVYTAPSGWQIVGFHGRSGDEVDKLGVVYAPRSAASEPASYTQLVNKASGLCMDVLNADMVNGKDVIQWHCNGGAWQQWNYDERTGMIRNKQNPRFCLDNSGSFADGANIVIWQCNGNANQRFTIDGSGAIRLRTYPQQVVDGYGTEAGDTVGTWSLRGGDNQYWIAD